MKMTITLELTSIAQVTALRDALDMYADFAKEGVADKDSGFSKADLEAVRQIQAALNGK